MDEQLQYFLLIGAIGIGATGFVIWHIYKYIHEGVISTLDVNKPKASGLDQKVGLIIETNQCPSSKPENYLDLSHMIISDSPSQPSHQSLLKEHPLSRYR